MARLVMRELRITNPTMRTFGLEAVVFVNEFFEDLDWTSHVTVSLSYQPRLIGEATLRDTYFLPDENKTASIKFEGFNIQNMMGFKAFIQHLLPNKVRNELGNKNGLTVAGRSVDEAHELSLNIELSGISKTLVKNFYTRVDEGTVTVDFDLSNSNPVELDFGNCVFSLEQGGDVLALMDGWFKIKPGDAEIVLQGDALVADTEYSGIATLKGVRAPNESNTWLAHAIRSFEVEVDLDRE